MKKISIFLLSATALLSLGACNGGRGDKGSKPQNWSDDVEEKELNDVQKANVEVAFNQVSDNCMVSPKIKAYVDAMEAQEKTLDRPYHFSSLYGPDDYKTLAAQADKGDGTTYADKDKGGVDVCELLNRNDYNNKTENYPIQLSWSNGDLSFNSARLYFWSTTDQSDVRDVVLGANATSATLANLYRSRKYRAQLVTDDGKVSQGFEFTTGDYPRVITMGDIKNVRDIGGYMTSYGVRTRQGLVYRGYYIDDKSGGHGVNYSKAAQNVQEEVMQIGIELDLQKESETNGRTESALNSEYSPCDYECLTLVSYDNFLKQDSYKNLPAVLDYIANADQKHVYFHCWGGADRTGMLAFFINAICGVSYTDLMEDFEITTETNNKRCHMHNSSSAHYPKFMDAFINGYTEGDVVWDGFDPNATVNQNCEKWLLEVPKIKPQTIKKIRQVMIPNYKDGMEQHIPTFTASGEWQSDELAHWKVSAENPNVKVGWARHSSGDTCSVCGHGGEGGQGGGGGQGEEVDYLQPLSRVWTEGTPGTNADGKQYIPLSEASTGKAGVKIKFTDYSPESTATVSSGKLGPVNDSTVYLTYKIKAPKAGTYQMVMNGRVSNDSYTLDKRKFKVTLNGASVDTQGSDRDGGLKADGDNDFVAVPSIQLTGNEDTFTVACCDNRIAFVESSYIVFIEH